MFEVEDNGVGILSSDLIFIGKKNWTTKEFSSNKHGYKGESLYFISFIAEVEIYSRHELDMSPQMMILKNGASVILSPLINSFRTRGTTVTLKSMFSDMPVRKSKLDHAKIISKVMTTLNRIAIIHPSIAFEVYDSFSRTSHLKTNGDINTSILDAFIKIRKNVIKKELFKRINYQEGQCKIEGFIGRIDDYKSKSIDNNIMIYINRNYLNKSKSFRNILNDIWPREYNNKESLTILIANIMYPTKVNCEYNEPSIMNVLLEIFKNCLLSIVMQDNDHKEINKSVKVKYKKKKILKSNISDQSMKFNKYSTINEDTSIKYLFKRWISSKPYEDIHVKHYTGNINSYVSKESIHNMKVLFQMDCKFIIVIQHGILYAFDQHAVDERIRYELIRNKIMSNIEGNIQRYAIYCEYRINTNQKDILITRQNHIEKFGWRYNIISENDHIILQITQSPFILNKKVEPKSILEYVSEIERSDYPNFPTYLLNIIKSKACRSAVKFGEYLDKNECQELIKNLSNCENPFECAHGRPSIMPFYNTHEYD